MDGVGSVARVERTFGFLDISGFTTYTDTFGDSAAVVALSTFRQVVREAASYHGVRVDKWLGDGAMFVGVDTGPLVSALLDIEVRLIERRFPLPLRAGVASGRVILFEGDDYVGTTVNLANRLCVDALPGQTLATEEIAAYVPEWVKAVRIGDVDVRGLAHPVSLIALERSLPSHAMAN